MTLAIALNDHGANSSSSAGRADEGGLWWEDMWVGNWEIRAGARRLFKRDERQRYEKKKKRYGTIEQSIVSVYLVSRDTSACHIP